MVHFTTKHAITTLDGWRDYLDHGHDSIFPGDDNYNKDDADQDDLLVLLEPEFLFLRPFAITRDMPVVAHYELSDPYIYIYCDRALLFLELCAMYS